MDYFQKGTGRPLDGSFASGFTDRVTGAPVDPSDVFSDGIESVAVGPFELLGGEALGGARMLGGGLMALGRRALGMAERGATREVESVAARRAARRAASCKRRRCGARAEEDRAPGTGPTQEERELAASSEVSPAAAAARRSVADDFYRQNGTKWDNSIGGFRPMTDAERASELRGIDYTRPVSVETTADTTRLYQWQVPGGRTGQYFTTDASAQPGALGINEQGLSASGDVVPKVQSAYDLPAGTTYLRSTAAPVTDTWSVPGVPQAAPGGGLQLYIPDRGAPVAVPPLAR